MKVSTVRQNVNSDEGTQALADSLREDLKGSKEIHMQTTTILGGGDVLVITLFS